MKAKGCRCLFDFEVNMNDAAINTHGLTIDFGKHSGELWTRVPVNYLLWMVNQPEMAADRKQTAQAELDRRGTVKPTIDISGHAIDRASLRFRKTWHQTALNDDEGLHAWLCRIATEALASGEKLESGKIRHLGIKFVFEEGSDWPVLKSVM